jgi:hypothetical protein
LEERETMLATRAADASIPDNPSGPNQAQSAEKANLSDAKCDVVLLDRTAPAVSIATRDPSLAAPTAAGPPRTRRSAAR